jgi:hypothetical protein
MENEDTRLQGRLDAWDPREPSNANRALAAREMP